MKKEPIVLLREFLVTQMNHWILFFVGATVLGLVNVKEPVFWKWAVFSAVPLLYFVVRRYTDRFLIFVVSHITVIAACVLLPCDSLTERILYCLLLTGYTVASVYFRISKADRFDAVLPMAVPILLAGACTFLLHHYRRELNWERYFVVPLILFFGCNFLRIYLEQYLHFLEVNKSSTGHIPMREMFLNGMVQVLLISAGMTGILLLTSDIGWVSQIVSVLKKALIIVMRWLFRGSGDEELSDIPVSETPEHTQGSGPAMPVTDNGGASTFWLILEQVFLFAAGLAFVALCIFLLYLLLRHIYRIFCKRMDREKKENGYSGEIRERCEAEPEKKQKSASFGVLSVRARIRRLYKKEVWDGRWRLKAGSEPEKLKRMTARECAEMLERSALASVYEKARYSDEDCTAEDLRRAKQ